tara:strand:- start:74 stop:220 length:147 start_codon:yes stop_codon:yes gene_type:complete
MICKKFKIIGIQASIVWGNPEENRNVFEKLIRGQMQRFVKEVLQNVVC